MTIKIVVGLVIWILCTRAIAQPAQLGIPKAKIKESTISCPMDSVLLDGWASIDPGGEIIEWRWTIDSDPVSSFTVTTGDIKIVAPAKPRTYTVKLVVKDNRGNVSAPDSANFCVMISLPKVNAGHDTTIKVGVRVSLTPKIVLNCGWPVEYQWDFNEDGKPEFQSTESPNTSRAFFKPGRYLARFTMKDNLGHEAGAIRIITVSRELPQ